MPKAVFWYGVYCYAFAAFNLGLFAFSVWITVAHDTFSTLVFNSQTYFWFGIVLMPLTLFMTGANIWIIKAKNLKDPWAFHLTNILVGLGTCVLAPCALPLVFFWFHPSVREYYRKPVNPP